MSVGLFCSTPGVAVGRAVPRKVAMEMLFTGEPITAQGQCWSARICSDLGSEHPDSVM